MFHTLRILRTKGWSKDGRPIHATDDLHNQRSLPPSLVFTQNQLFTEMLNLTPVVEFQIGGEMGPINLKESPMIEII